MQQPNAINYGATGHVANNPFAAMSSTIPEESAMPEQTVDATNTYGAYDYTQQQQQQQPQMPSYDQQYQQPYTQQEQQANYQQPYQTQ